MKTSLMDLNRITVDPAMQSRVNINDAVVEEYADVLLDGGKLPPPVVFFDGENYILGGGFHRYGAHRLAGKRGMTVEIRQGTARDALWFSVSENADHGLRRSAGDKRKAVMTLLDDEEWSKLPLRKIADQACVSHTLVEDIKNELAGTKKPPTKLAPATKKEKVTVQELNTTVGSSGVANYSVPDGETTRPGPAAPPPDQRDDPVIVLAEENDRLFQRLAIGAADGYSEEERGALKTLLDDLHAELASTRAERDSIASQRDAYMRERNELVKQVSGLQRKLKKLEAVSA